MEYGFQKGGRFPRHATEMSCEKIGRDEERFDMDREFTERNRQKGNQKIKRQNRTSQEERKKSGGQMEAQSQRERRD